MKAGLASLGFLIFCFVSVFCPARGGGAEDGERGILLGWGCVGAAFGQVFDVDDRPPRLRQLAKDVRAALRRFRRQVSFALGRWHDWLPKIFFGSTALVVIGAADREWLRALAAGQWREAQRGFSLGAAVFVGLLMDRRAPFVGKALLVAALVYLVSIRDLLWDPRVPSGLLDDVIVVTLGARGFVATCPDALVEWWARRVVARQRLPIAGTVQSGEGANEAD